MLDPEIGQALKSIFDAHDDAIRALREANVKRGAANESIGAANERMGLAIQAHDDAIQAALGANRGALDLLANLEGRP